MPIGKGVVLYLLSERGDSPLQLPPNSLLGWIKNSFILKDEALEELKGGNVFAQEHNTYINIVGTLQTSFRSQCN